MRLIFLLSTLALLVFTGVRAAEQYSLVNKARELNHDGEFDKAHSHTIRVLNQNPSFFRKEALSIVGENSLHAGLEAVRLHEYTKAIDWLTGLLQRGEKELEEYQQRATAILLKLPEQHLKWAKELCNFGSYIEAGREFKLIQELYTDEDILYETRSVSATCQVRQLRYLYDKGKFDDILQRATLPNLPDMPEITSLIIGAIEGAVQGMFYKRRYKHGFEVLEWVEEEFSRNPEIINRIHRLKEQAEQEVFGFHIGNNFRKPLPALKVDSITDQDQASFIFKNRTAHSMKVICRGSEKIEFSLAPKREYKSILKPGEYVFAAIFPRKQERPYKGDFIAQSGEIYHQIFIE